MTENEQTKSFVMYESFFEAAEQMQMDDAAIGKYVMMLRAYAIKGQELKCDDGRVNALLTLTKPLIAASTTRYKKAVKGGEHGWKGGEHGIKGGRPRLGETKEEAYERRAKERELKEQEHNQEPLLAAEPKTAVKAPENPKNPLNVDANEKENDYVKDDDYAYVYEKGDVSGYEDIKDNPNEKEKDYVDEKDFDKENDFMSSLILDDFEEEEYSSFGIGSMSNYIEGKLLEEQERLYRQSQELEEDRELYI